MPAFRPGIGKREVQAGNRSGRQKKTNRVINLQAQYANIGQTQLGCGAECFANPTEETLHTKKISFRVLACRFNQKTTRSRAQIDFDGSIIFENGREGKGFNNVTRNDFQLLPERAEKSAEAPPDSDMP